jgi:hypothetical protein
MSQPASGIIERFFMSLTAREWESLGEVLAPQVLRIGPFGDLGDLFEGVMRVSGQLQESLEPFEARVRIRFHDEPDGRTRLEIRQWLPAHLAGLSSQGWLEAFERLDATLRDVQAVAVDVEV